MILVWGIAALLGAGLLYLALPLLAVVSSFLLRLIGIFVLACIAYRVILFLIFVGINYLGSS